MLCRTYKPDLTGTLTHSYGCRLILDQSVHRRIKQRIKQHAYKHLTFYFTQLFTHLYNKLLTYTQTIMISILSLINDCHCLKLIYYFKLLATTQQRNPGDYKILSQNGDIHLLTY